MKATLWNVCSLTLLAGMIWLGRPATVRAADNDTTTADRLDRLEQRINQIAERQEQLMRRSGAPRQGGPSQLRQPAARNLHPDFRPRLRPQWAPAAVPPVAQPHPGVARMAKSIHDLLGLFFLIAVICHILLAIWIYTDIRKRGEGSGIFIALALVAGIPAALIYALTRIGERKA